MKISSIKISFKLESISKKNIKFNERLGSGSEFYLGEESVFLSDCLKKGLNIIYVPIIIGTVQTGNSTWFEGYTKKYFYSKGAAYYCMSKSVFLVLIIQFAIRKHKLYCSEINIIKAIYYMLLGVYEYIK